MPALLNDAEKRERHGLEERQGSRQSQIDEGIAHQFRSDTHQMKQLFCEYKQQGTHREAKQQVDHQSHAHHLHQSLLKPGTDVLSAEDGCTHREELIDQKHQRDELVVQPHSRHTIVAVAAEHHRIDGTQHHDECHLYKHWNGEHLQLPFQRMF